MFCKACGAPMEESYNLCQECGTRKGEGNAFCSQCGAVRQVGNSFCVNCGAPVEESAPTQSGSTPYAQQTAAQQFQSQAQMDNSQYMPPKKFCRNCGTQVMNTQVVCTQCGVKVGEGNSFCPHCGSQVAPDASVCMSCGMSVKPAFDIGKMVSKTLDNVVSVFKSGDIFNIVLDHGAYFMSLLIFIFSLIPSCYIKASVSILGMTGSSEEHYNVFQMAGFAGFLFIIALIISVARFVPMVDDFIQSNALVKRFHIFVVPGITLIGFIIYLASVLLSKVIANGSAATSAYGSATADAGLNFFGFVLLLMVLFSVATSVLSFLRKEQILKF